MKLLLTEKRDAAEKIAAAMGWKAENGGFVGTLGGEKVQVRWARGHLLELAPPEDISDTYSWKDPRTLEKVPTTFPRRVIFIKDSKTPESAQPKAYLNRMKEDLKAGVSEFIIATDADREGEAIGWSIVEHLKFKGKISRCWLAAGLDEKSIKDALNNLRSGDEMKPWYYAAEARGRSDWSFMFLVRAYTYYANRRKFGPRLGQGEGAESVMSVGRVQSPALAMIVRREREIQNFRPQKHFKLAADFLAGTGLLTASYRPVVTREIINAMPEGVSWVEGKPGAEGEDALETPLFTGEAQVKDFMARAKKAGPQSKVVAFKTGKRKEAPPKTFSLTDAQAAIAKACRIDANLAQVIVEDLYEQGWTSYPRTPKAELPMNFYQATERNAMLSAVMGLPELAKAAKTVMDIHNGKDASVKAFVPSVFVEKDLPHHGIVPTTSRMSPAALAGLSPKKKDGASVRHTAEMMRTAYLLIARQYVQAMFPPAEYATQTAEISVPTPDLLGHPAARFAVKGEQLVVPGWRGAFNEGAEKDTRIPVLKEGMITPLKDIHAEEAMTTPPNRYTEITFPKAMEMVGRDVTDPKLRKLLKDSEGLGTPATRKEVINILKRRSYVEVKKGAFYPTDKGMDLVDKVEPWLVSPETTALWEDYLVKICGTKNVAEAAKMRDNFVTKSIARIEAMIAGMNERFSDVLPKPGELPFSGAPSSEQLAFAERVARSVGEKLTDDQKANRSALKAFIDLHKDSMPPSEAALKFARDLAAKLPADKQPDESVFASASKVREFIEQATGKTSSKSKSSSPARKGGSTGARKAASPRPAAKARAGAKSTGRKSSSASREP